MYQFLNTLVSLNQLCHPIVSLITELEKSLTFTHCTFDSIVSLTFKELYCDKGIEQMRSVRI